MLHDTFLRIFGRMLFAPEIEGAGADPEPDEGAEPEEGDEPDEGAEPEEGDEPDEGAEPEEGDEPDEGAQPSRKENRVSKLAKEAREERDRRISLETENRLLRETSTSKPTNDEARRIREEKLSLMEPADRKDFLRDEELLTMKNSMQMTQVQLADMTDRAAYDTKAATNPIYAKNKEWVENTLRAERTAGRNPSRELLIRVKIGEDALKPRSKKQSAAEKAAAAERVKKAKGKTLSARGDVGTTRGDNDSVDALKKRILDREARGDM